MSFFEGSKLTVEGVRFVRERAAEGDNVEQILSRIPGPHPGTAGHKIAAYVAVATRRRNAAEREGSSVAATDCSFIEDGVITQAGRLRIRELAAVRPKLKSKEILARVAPGYDLQRMTALVAYARRKPKSS